MITLRYDRQLRIHGWNQDRIAKLKVGVIGGDYGAFYTLLPLVSMGVGEHGEIRILASKINRARLLDMKINLESDLIEVLSRVNPLVKNSIRYFRIDLIREELKLFLKDLDIVIDTTNDPTSKAVALLYAVENRAKYISFSTMPCYGRLNIIWENNSIDLSEIDFNFFMPEFKQTQQEELMSMLFGGIAASSISNYAANKRQQNDEVIYNSLSEDRLTPPSTRDFPQLLLKYVHRDPALADFSPYRVVMIGAGALGNPVAIALSKIRIGELIIIDYDIVEETNLNRQYCFYDSVNKPKANALAEKVLRMSGGETKAIPVKEKFTLDKALNGDLAKYFRNADLILALVDNFDARADAADLAEQLGIPLISAGTSPFTGHVAVYLPRETKNLNEVMKYREHAKTTDRLRCIEVHEPSVVTSNQVIGALVALEAIKILKPQIFGKPLDKPLTYYSYLRRRFEV